MMKYVEVVVDSMAIIGRVNNMWQYGLVKTKDNNTYRIMQQNLLKAIVIH